MEGAEDKRYLQLSQTPLESEDAANRYFYQMVVDQYIDFGIFVTSPSYAHTAEEYAHLFPGRQFCAENSPGFR